jgi:ferric-dicitrate binding protein FerR (iron transport regulator)
MDTATEVFELSERVVIATSSGRVALPPVDARPAEGEFVMSGDSLATVRVGDGEVPVRTEFRGWLMGFLVLDGQPIRPGEPVAWLRKA